MTNGLVLKNRVTPFTANELKLISSTIDILFKYFNTFEIILLGFVLILAISGLIFILIKAPKTKEKINYKKNGSLVLAGIISFFLFTQLAISTNLIETTFGNIAFAYLDYGFPYCFGNSLVNTGIRRPINYSEDSVLTLSEKIESSFTAEDTLANSIANADNFPQQLKQKQPNIIFIQLESFFDPTHMIDLEFSEDPVPNFRKLKENYSSGYLTVPSIGAGTANTEFEVITGMSLQFFGPGEYPYKTILRETTAESINYNLANLDYETHAIHNNRGTFYTRQGVFKSLGFNTFTSIEYMNKVEDTTPTGWAKDKVLIDPIFDALKSTEESDFIYTISVQGHGDYPTTPIDGHSEIKVTGWDDKERLTGFEYFTNEIHDMDRFIGEMVNHLSLFPEDTVLVLYGDHLPTFNITDEELSNGDIFQTEYVIWSNFDLEKEDINLTAYQLNAHLLNKLGIHEGTLTKFHQNFKKTPEYLTHLKLLQYDMLYGNQFIYNGENPFQRTQMKMGVKPVFISEVYPDENGNLYVVGENFNDYSRLKINTSTYATTFIDKNTLFVENYKFNENDTFSVQQVTSTNFVLGTSEPFSLNLETEITETFEQGYQEGFEAGFQEALKSIDDK